MSGTFSVEDLSGSSFICVTLLTMLQNKATLFFFWVLTNVNNERLLPSKCER